MFGLAAARRQYMHFHATGAAPRRASFPGAPLRSGLIFEIVRLRGASQGRSGERIPISRLQEKVA
jgi:hypothetical protein